MAWPEVCFVAGMLVYGAKSRWEFKATQLGLNVSGQWLIALLSKEDSCGDGEHTMGGVVVI